MGDKLPACLESNIVYDLELSSDGLLRGNWCAIPVRLGLLERCNHVYHERDHVGGHWSTASLITLIEYKQIGLQDSIGASIVFAKPGLKARNTTPLSLYSAAYLLTARLRAALEMA